MIARVVPVPSLLRRLRGDSSGATLVEFAFVGPVLILMIMGLFDIAHTQYSSSVLHGALQKAGRDLTLENAGTQQTNIDDRVRDQIKSVMPNGATITIVKQNYADFDGVNRPEDFTDVNNNGTCDNDEPYEESNGTAGWQRNRGKTGIGGARDVVLYTTNVSYQRLFPMFSMIGLPADVKLSASTVLRNQPFDDQPGRATTVGKCP